LRSLERRGDGLLDGRAIVLKVAAEYQDELTGIVGSKLGLRAGRYNEFLHHPAIHAASLRQATLWLNARLARASRRENWWYYSQSGPALPGDVYFYSIDWDAREDVKRIDTICARSRCSRRIRLFLHAGDERAVARDHRLAAHIMKAWAFP